MSQEFQKDQPGEQTADESLRDLVPGEETRDQEKVQLLEDFLLVGGSKFLQSLTQSPEGVKFLRELAQTSEGLEFLQDLAQSPITIRNLQDFLENNESGLRILQALVDGEGGVPILRWYIANALPTKVQALPSAIGIDPSESGEEDLSSGGDRTRRPYQYHPLDQEQEQGEETAKGLTTTIKWRKPRMALLAATGISVIIVLAGMLSFYVFWQPSATLTIKPIPRGASADFSVTIVSGSPDLPQQQIQGHLLPGINQQTQAETVGASGTKSYPAEVARGYVIFYNSALGPQSQGVAIPAKTILVAKSGISVETEQDAWVPYGTGDTNGASGPIPAHAMTAGSVGDIAPLDVYQSCCSQQGSNIVAKNWQAFTGGKDARKVAVIEQTDVSRATDDLSSSLKREEQDNLQKQLRDEDNAILYGCQSQVVASPPIGTEGESNLQVRISMTLTCSGAAYKKAQLQELILQQAARQLGYKVSERKQQQQISDVVPTGQQGQLLIFHVHTDGQYTRQVTDRDVALLVHGQSRSRATNLLRKQGLELLDVTGIGRGSPLPSDPSKIEIHII